MALFKTYVRDRDKLIKTVGIAGLRKNFGRDDGRIEQPYWGPSKSNNLSLSFTRVRYLSLLHFDREQIKSPENRVLKRISSFFEVAVLA